LRKRRSLQLKTLGPFAEQAEAARQRWDGKGDRRTLSLNWSWDFEGIRKTLGKRCPPEKREDPGGGYQEKKKKKKKKKKKGGVGGTY